MEGNEQLAEIILCKIIFQESPRNIEYLINEISKSNIYIYQNTAFTGNKVVAEFKLSDYSDDRDFDKRQFVISPKVGDNHQLFDLYHTTKIEIGIPAKTKCTVLLFPESICSELPESDISLENTNNIISNEIEFCEECACVKKDGLFIYTSRDGNHSFDLPIMLSDYKEFLIEKGIVKETGK